MKGPHYYVVVYDAQVRRVAKVLKTLRKYLHWVQNSVFEGVLSESQFLKLKRDLAKVIDPSNDSIIFYKFPKKWLDRETMGIEKGDRSNII